MAYIKTDDGYYQHSFPQYGFGFLGAGNSICFYRYSLYWLVHQVGLGDVAVDIQKDGELFLYGRMPVEEFERLVAAGRIVGLKRHVWGVSWAYHDQGDGSVFDLDGYTDWRNGILEETKGFIYGPPDHSGWSGQMSWSA